MTLSRFTPEHRRTMIMDIARERGRLLVEDLVQEFSASSETIRRDLNHLAAAGALRKFHGGACLPSLVDETPFSIRMSEQISGKRAIARAAARLFTNGDSLFIDTGTTTLFLAEELVHLSNLSVVTNSSTIAAALSGNGNTIFVLGGLYQADAGETIGPATIEQIGRFHASHAVLTIGAIHPKNGVMDFSLGEAQVARAMIEHADHVTVIADRSKVGRGAFGKVCTLETIDRFITDIAPAPDMTQALLDAGVELVVAD
jgi:DeoR family glycerol-3-phosphate regulon repressor